MCQALVKGLHGEIWGLHVANMMFRIAYGKIWVTIMSSHESRKSAWAIRPIDKINEFRDTIFGFNDNRMNRLDIKN